MDDERKLLAVPDSRGGERSPRTKPKKTPRPEPVTCQDSRKKFITVPSMPEGFSRLRAGHGTFMALSNTFELCLCENEPVEDSYDLFNIRRIQPGSDTYSIKALNSRYVSVITSAATPTLGLTREIYAWRIISVTGVSNGYLIQCPKTNLWICVALEALALRDQPLTLWGTPTRASEAPKQELMQIKIEELKDCKIEIGEGQYGKIYLTMLRNQLVAVKILKGLPTETQKSFNAEVEAMALIRHPNIVLFMGVCLDPTKSAIITEYMENGTLASVLSKPDLELSHDLRFKMAQDISCGIAWLHGCRPPVIHRDLKPENLLVSKNFAVKLCDFGLSISVEQADILSQRSLTSDLGVGTPVYMAPESLLGQAVTEKVDVYAFALVFWEIMTRQQPFPDISSLAQLKKFICEDQKRPFTGKLPKEFAAQLNQMWAHSPHKRPEMSFIHRKMGNLMAASLLSCPLAVGLWRLPAFGDGFRISFKVFYEKLLEALPKPHPPPTPQIEQQLIRLLCADEHKFISTEKFGFILHWFGPLTETYKLSWIERFGLASQLNFFYPYFDKKQAEELLTRHGDTHGAFLLRLNATSDPENFPFTVSFRHKNIIQHARIKREPNGFGIPTAQKYIIPNDGWITGLFDMKDKIVTNTWKSIGVNIKKGVKRTEVDNKLKLVAGRYMPDAPQGDQDSSN